MARRSGSKKQGSVDSRLASLESVVERFEVDLSSLRQELSAQISALSTKIDQGGRTNWNQWGVLGMFVLAVVGYIVSPMQVSGDYRDQRMAAIEQALRNQEAVFRGHEMLDGHPTALEISRQLRSDHEEMEEDVYRRLSDLDSALQREMRLINDRTNQRIESLDRRLQTEMRMVADTASVRSENSYLHDQLKETRELRGNGK